MLFSVDSKVTKITHIPHERDYRRWHGRLNNDEYAAIQGEIQRMIEGDRVHTSSWMPGNDWTGTPFEPIYTKACEYDEVASGLCFGLFVWVIFQEHELAWSFGRYKKDGMQIRGMTYFRIPNMDGQ
jgi:hypothetical protein